MEVRCLYDKLVPISDLNLNPKNRNAHPKEQIERLAHILKYQGWRYPVKVSNETGMVTSGHGRVEAAAFNGWLEVPVNFQDYDTPEQEYADLIADNAIASWSELDLSGVQLDVKGLSTDFNPIYLGLEERLPDVDKLPPGCDEDEVPENVEPRTKLGDCYQLGMHRLLCGDSTSIDAVERLMDGELVDCLWTDPPYNVALGMETPEQAKARNRRTDGLTVMNDKMSDEDFRQFLRDAFTTGATVCRPGGAMYIAHADSEGYNFRGAARDSGWLIKQCLIWKKSSLVMGRQDYQWIHEPILYGWRDGGSHSWYGDRKQTTVLEFQKPSKNPDHPTMKPVELIEYCLNNSTKSGDRVLDLFSGSGTTLVACEKLGRISYGLELDPKYCDTIVARYEKYSGNKAVLLEG